jgi:hypothetical protein
MNKTQLTKLLIRSADNKDIQVVMLPPGYTVTAGYTLTGWEEEHVDLLNLVERYLTRKQEAHYNYK